MQPCDTKPHWHRNPSLSAATRRIYKRMHASHSTEPHKSTFHRRPWKRVLRTNSSQKPHTLATSTSIFWAVACFRNFCLAVHLGFRWLSHILATARGFMRPFATSTLISTAVMHLILALLMLMRIMVTGVKMIIIPMMIKMEMVMVMVMMMIIVRTRVQW